MIQCTAIILENRSKSTIFEINKEWVNKEWLAFIYSTPSEKKKCSDFSLADTFNALTLGFISTIFSK